MKKIKSLLAIAVASLSLSSCNTAATNALVQGATLTNEQFIQATKSSVAQLDQQNKVAPANSPYTQRLNKITAGLTDLEGLPLNFKVYETKEVNAFACPDGSVRVYTGIMDLMTDDELLGIIGHEIGHVAMEHSKKAYQQQLYQSALFSSLAGAGGKIGALTNSQLGQMGAALVGKWGNAKFSRKEENEADAFAYDFLKGAGRNPYVIVEAFEKMQQLERQAANSGQQQSINNFFGLNFSSHPEMQERIDRITKMCERDGFKRP